MIDFNNPYIVAIFFVWSSAILGTIVFLYAKFKHKNKK